MKKLFALLLVLTMVLTLTGCKKDDYESAVALMDAGSYEEAIIAFTELGDYEDSVQRLEECKNTLSYEKAIMLFEQDQYEEALEIFVSLGNYKDSIDKKKECEDYIAYNSAIALIDEAKYAEARAIFETIPNFKDVAEYLDRFHTIEITSENWGNYFEIILVPYFDAFERLEEICYKFVFKEEYKDTVVYGDEFSIDVAYKGIGTTASVEYNKQDDLFTFGPELPGWGGHVFYDDILTFDNADFCKMAVSREEIIDNKEMRDTCNLVNNHIYHEDAGNGCASMEHNIENIKGTIILFCND